MPLYSESSPRLHSMQRGPVRATAVRLGATYRVALFYYGESRPFTCHVSNKGGEPLVRRWVAKRYPGIPLDFI